MGFNLKKLFRLPKVIWSLTKEGGGSTSGMRTSASGGNWSSTSRWATAADSHENRGWAGLAGPNKTLSGDSRSPSAPGAPDPAGSVAAPPHPFCSRLAPNQGSSPPTCEATPPPECFNPNVDIDKTNYNGSLRLRGLARGPADRPARPTRAGQDPLASCQNCFEKNLGSDPVAPRHSNSARPLAHCQPSAPACQRSGSRCRRSRAIRQGFAGGAPTPRPIVLIDAVKWRY